MYPSRLPAVHSGTRGGRAADGRDRADRTRRHGRFSAAVRKQLGKGLGESPPSIGIVQKAVGRLTRSEVLLRVERGQVPSSR